MKNEMIFFERDLISEIFEGVENHFDELAGKMKNILIKSLSALSDQEYLAPLSLSWGRNDEFKGNWKDNGNGWIKSKTNPL